MEFTEILGVFGDGDSCTANNEAGVHQGITIIEA